MDSYNFSESEDSPLKSYKPIKRFSDSPLTVNQKGDADSIECIEDRGSTCSMSEEKTVTSIPMTACESAETIPENNVKRPIQRRIVCMHSAELVKRCDCMIKIPMRASTVSSLLEAFDLHKYMRLVSPVMAAFEELCMFHSADYLEFLQKISEQDDDEKYDEEAQHYGLSYDCPAHFGVYEYTSLVCGATMQAAQCLMDDKCDVAINWYGGWHHGKKDGASGFCYTNDIVLGILKLRQKYSRVLYVDLDLHHGDGVQDAFSSTNKVMTVSVHKYMVGFFPGTGSIQDIGYSKGRLYSVNIPLQDGVRDMEFAALVCRVLVKVKEKFQPEAIVCQCGADGISGDPMESFNLTPLSLGKCIHTLLSWKLPLLLLGGGGYHHTNTARCWAYLTSIVVGKKLNNDIPDHENLLEYGPDYDLGVTPGNMKNLNTPEYLQGIHSQIMYNLNQLPP